MTSATDIKISVLIITRNRSFILGDCLDALRPQIDENKHEVVVVDSSEDNKTKDLIKNYPWVQYHQISLPLGTRPQSYSYGAKQCSGEIAMLLDDDAIVLPNWLETLETCFDDPAVGIAGGRVLPREGVLISECNSLDPIGVLTSDGRIISNLYIDCGSRREVNVLRGCNMAVRKLLLEQMNFFDPRFRGQNCRVEDDICLWVKRLGFKVIYEPKAVVRHLAEERPDIPRSEYNMCSEFYVWRNTVWLYVKHFGLVNSVIPKVAFVTPFLTCLRRVFNDSLKRPKITRQSIRYIPSALAGIAGGFWGLFMSIVYLLGERMSGKLGACPKLKAGQLSFFRKEAGLVL